MYLGRKRHVGSVEDKPGVTRDRVSYKAEWVGKRFTLVDTGGWESDARGIDAQVADQAEIAVEQADVCHPRCGRACGNYRLRRTDRAYASPCQEAHQ